MIDKKKSFILFVLLFVFIFSTVSFAETEQLTEMKETSFTITIPKEISIDGQTGKASYVISAKGDIINDQTLSITPENNFYLKENGGKSDINGVITQSDVDYSYLDLQNSGTNQTGEIDVSTLSAGEWSGTFNFSIHITEHVHNYQLISETEATCTENGYKTYLCEPCGASYREKIANATGHNYISIYTAPTETEKGYTTYTCQNCEDTYIVYDEDTPEHTHNYNSEITIIPTCTSDGQITYTCSDCNDIYTDIISATGHNYILEITKEATCTEEGLKTYTCQNCGDNYTETINALGHDYNSVLTTEATETQNGEITHTCSRCGDSYTESVEPSFATMSWASISSVSEAGIATSMFNIGDEKELQIGSETYHVQILGFDHDDKSDGTGKTGITVGLKEIMTTTHNMNSNNLNGGGWEQSNIRTYLQNDILPTLPNDLQAVIKTVNKKSDIGNKDTRTLNTTQDKLFLLSTAEVGGDSFSAYDVDDQGTQYEYFTDDVSRTKKYLSGNSGSWWLRSTWIGNNTGFFDVNYNGSYGGYDAYVDDGVVFGFCI